MKHLFNKTHYSPGELSKGGKILTYTGLMACLSLFLFPVAWMFFTSVKSLDEIVSNPLSFFSYYLELVQLSGSLPEPPVCNLPLEYVLVHRRHGSRYRFLFRHDRIWVCSISR